MSTPRSSIPAGTERAGTPRPSTARTPPATAHKYVTGGYFAVASDYHRSIGLNGGRGDFIGNYFLNGKIDAGYFRLQSSEDMVLENLAKYYARYARSPFVQDPAVSKTEGVMVGGAKIIWSDSVTDGRMRDMEVARVSGAVDGARLPKEVFYGLQVAQNTRPQVHVVGHWNYPAGTVKPVYVAANTAKVKLQTLDPSGKVVKDYGFGRNDFARARNDQVNHYCYRFENVAWQPGTIRATGYDATGKGRCHGGEIHRGPPRRAQAHADASAPAENFYADGSDVAMFDVEVLDAAGNRCPTFEDRVDFTCSGEGVFLGGYNSGIRYSTNGHLTDGLSSQCRVRHQPGLRSGDPPRRRIHLNVSRPGLSPASQTIASTPVAVQGGLMTQMPPVLTASNWDPNPAPMKAEGFSGPGEELA